MPSQPINLLQGTLDLLVLRALAGEPRHGYAVVDWVRKTTAGTFEIEDGALYHALHRMQKRGWLVGEWGVSERNRRAKFYTLTEEGRQQLARARSEWHRYTNAVAKVLEGEV
jgi:transcriptional regulator